MWLFVGVLYLAVCFVAPFHRAGPPDSSANSRIIGGNEASPNSWPWQLSLRVNGRHNCGASLISRLWVLTAAHCVLDVNPANITIVAGAHKRVNDGTVYSISKYIIHRGFNMSHFKHDIALVELRYPISLSSKVYPIRLPTYRDNVFQSSQCYISGWGRILSTDLHKLPLKLQQSKVPVVDRDTCAKKNSEHVDERTMICIGGAGSSGCNGDSGGPLMCREYPRHHHWVLYGAASWVTALTCPGDAYTVYARVDTHIRWIKRNTDDLDIDCRDILRYCKYNVLKKRCRKSAWIRKICKMTCGICDGLHGWPGQR